MTPRDAIPAIQTRYAGCHFRSRLEARWAVVFDALEIKWQYEPEGYVLSDGTRYLPDFVINNLWVEVKGTDNGWPRLWSIAWDHPVLVLGPIPALDSDCSLPLHPLLQVYRTPERGLPTRVLDGTPFVWWVHLLPHEIRQLPTPWGYASQGPVGGVAGRMLDHHTHGVRGAYAQGREARFEHGQTPQRPVEAPR
jgi:hypothetical protein